MDRLTECDMVKIVALHGPPEAHLIADVEDDDWTLPRIGDVGIIVHLLSADGRRLGNPDEPGTRYIVEHMAGQRTLWLAEFARGELQLVSRPG